MSMVAKATGKIFKKLVVKPIEKIWEKRRELAKLAVIAAAVYFTVGTASAYFAAPEAGLGSAMSSTANGMWSSATSFMSGGEAVAADTAASTATASAATPLPEIAAQPLAPAVTPAMESAAYEASLSSAPAAAPAPGLVSQAMTGAGNLVKDYPIATLMIGSGLSNAYQAKQAKEAEAAARESRGTFGFDYRGNSRYEPTGIVSSQMQAPQAQQQQRVRPIARSNLAQIQPQDIKRKV